MPGRGRRPIPLNGSEEVLLLKQPNPRAPTGLRNLCLLNLMLRAGLRVNEVISLEEADIGWEEGSIVARESPSAAGRRLFLEDGDLELLEKWRALRPDCEVFFCTLDGRPLSDRYIREMVKRLARRAGIRKDVYPQLLRYTFACNFFREIGDPHLLQKALGHRDSSATRGYLDMILQRAGPAAAGDSRQKRSGFPFETGQLRLETEKPDMPGRRVGRKPGLKGSDHHGQYAGIPETEEPVLSVEELESPPGPIDCGDNAGPAQPVQESGSFKETPSEVIYGKEGEEGEEDPGRAVEKDESATAQRIPPLKCSNCSYILRHRQNCPQCGTAFDDILKHWGKNI